VGLSIGGPAHAGGPGSILRRLGSKDEQGTIKGSVLLRLLQYVRPYWWQMALAMCLMLVTTGGNLLVPYLIKVAIDENIAAGDTAGLLVTCLQLAALLVCIYLATSGQLYILSWVGQRLLVALREQLFSHLQMLSVPFHDRHIVGVTVSRVINDVEVINELLSQGLIRLVGDSLLLVGTIVVMLSVEPRLALLTFSVMPLMVLITALFSRRARVAFRETRQTIGAVVGDMAENLDGIRIIQAFTQQEITQERFESINRENRDANVRAVSLSFLFLPAVDVLSVAAMCIVLGVGGLMVVQGGLTIGIMVAFMAYVGRFFDPIRDLSQIYTTLQAATAGGERVLELLDTEPNVVDRPQAIDLSDLEGRVELRDVCFQYNPDKVILHDLSMSIEPGQTVALVGPTGAGKTTIANLVARFYEVSEGSVSMDGQDVRDVTAASLHRQMGLVPQDPFLFSGTVADNIRFGRPGADREAVVAAARAANADEFIRNLPQGYDTEILEGGVNLSLGQRQLICIARALLVEPRILIMDEATSSVDTMTESLIQQALERLLSGRTAIVIAHRLSTVRFADWIYVVEAGRIVEQGNHQDLLDLGGLYRDLYERQFVDASLAV
jgi:ATP-binding cassette subfamily B multidrug efflux pump